MVLFFCCSSFAFAQTSIHMEEAGKYSRLGIRSLSDYDAMNGFVVMDLPESKAAPLDKIVFGYHPYWGGSNFLNYRWDLLSDLCYFSYEVDAATGQAVTMHDWLSSPAIDSALAHGVRVHLCVSLFSGHSQFFGNIQSRQTLSNNLIGLLRDRGAHGVNLDFEAVPASQGAEMLDYIAEFSTALHDSLPGAILSIAMPAVDWNGIFDVGILNQYIDLFMIMGYDYYWNGSSQAGPVDPLYAMTAGYNYSVSRTISYYQSEGMPEEKMLLGVPYYAREWGTAGGTAPSSVTAYGTAYTWANVMNNSSGNYSQANKRMEPASFGVYYAFENNGWRQCFINDENAYHRRYRLVNRRGLSGIGIWALGYDNGFSALWEVIGSEFTNGPQYTVKDTLFDSGGPAWEYYNGEDYCLQFHGMEGEMFQLEFTSFDLEEGYDSIWIYDGFMPGASLLAGYSGNTLPPVLTAANQMSIRFHSDQNTRAGGWRAVISGTLAGNAGNSKPSLFKLFPVPVHEKLNIELAGPDHYTGLSLYDINGRRLYSETIHGDPRYIAIDLQAFQPGIYILSLTGDKGISHQQKIVKQ